MCIPYGILIAIGGIIAALAGNGSTALCVAGAGVAEVALSNLSLKAWRQGQSATLFTLLSAAIAGIMGWMAWKGLQQGILPYLSGFLLALSAAVAIFLVYNVLAGGNPPPQKKGLEGAAVDDTSRKQE